MTCALCKLFRAASTRKLGVCVIAELRCLGFRQRLQAPPQATPWR